MAIIFDEKRKQFYLHTKNTSYVMEIYAEHLAHTYWGARVKTVPLLDELYPYRFGSDFSATDLAGHLIFSTDKLPQEFPTFGSADMREPAFHARYENGSAISKFFYQGYRVLLGKPSLKGLPSTYAEEDECETLEITLKDDYTGVKVILSYSIFEKKDVLTRSVRIINEGRASCIIEAAESCSVDLYGHDYQILHLPGAWARERRIAKTELSYGSFVIESRRGASSHNHNPFLALVSRETTENYGPAMGFCLVYSGSFMARATVEQFGTTRVQIGLNPFDFQWELNPGEVFQTPEVIMVYSERGLGEMTRRFHRIIRKNLCRGKYRDGKRPVLINNWEATYFDFDEEKILNIAAKARKIGAELMVLDDGWFGNRIDDKRSLGDWYPDRQKLPGGLKELAKKINRLEMQFGLWIEPEMISVDSELYRLHPDWCIHTENRPRTEGRNQLILDFARKEVREYILGILVDILEKNKISYVKWDMNRNMTEIAYPEQSHRYILGLYSILETLTTQFPDVLFESCSGGGGRFDAGMLYYMPQIWTSDDTDALERLYIQEGTFLVYPLSTMGAHVSAVPNHQVGRVTPITFRGDVALMGRFGLEFELDRIEKKEWEILEKQIEFYKTYQQVIHQGELYRLASVYAGKYAAYEIISEDGNTVLVFCFNIKGMPNTGPNRIFLQGLEKERRYKNLENGAIWEANALMNVGIPVDVRHDMESFIHIYEKI